MFDLNWKEISYRIEFKKGSKVFPFITSLAPIPTEELIRYDHSLARPSRTEADGGTLMDLSPSGLEVALFDKYFRSIGSEGPTNLSAEELVKRIPVQVKRATIQDGVGGVWPEEEHQEQGSWEDLIEPEITVNIVAVANGQLHPLQHKLREPTAEEETTYRRATAGTLRALPGRRRREFLVVENFSIYPKMYDALIKVVSGYTALDKPIDIAVSKEWLSKIPYYHKKTVVRQVFGSAQMQDKDDEFFRGSLHPDSSGDEA